MEKIVFLIACVGMLAFAPASRAQVTPGNERPPQQSASAPVDGNPKTCVREQVPTTRVVYCSEEKEFCKPHTRFLHMLGHCCGLCDAAPCGGCEVWTKRVLIKKVVPGPTVEKCVLR